MSITMFRSAVQSELNGRKLHNGRIIISLSSDRPDREYSRIDQLKKLIPRNKFICSEVFCVEEDISDGRRWTYSAMVKPVTTIKFRYIIFSNEDGLLLSYKDYGFSTYMDKTCKLYVHPSTGEAGALAMIDKILESTMIKDSSHVELKKEI